MAGISHGTGPGLYAKNDTGNYALYVEGTAYSTGRHNISVGNDNAINAKADTQYATIYGENRGSGAAIYGEHKLEFTEFPQDGMELEGKRQAPTITGWCECWLWGASQRDITTLHPVPLFKNWREGNGPMSSSTFFQLSLRSILFCKASGMNGINV